MSLFNSITNRFSVGNTEESKSDLEIGDKKSWQAKHVLMGECGEESA